MSKKSLKIYVHCAGTKKTLESLDSQLNIRLSRALYFRGVDLEQQYVIEPPVRGYLPTGDYDIQIFGHTPEIVNGERISSHDVQCLNTQPCYEFVAVLTTTPMPKLSLKTQRILARKKLLSPPNGVNGYLEATLTGKFQGWRSEAATANEPSYTATFEASSRDYQPVADFASLAEGLEDPVFTARTADPYLADKKNYFFKFDGSKLLLKYGETVQPVIDSLSPSDQQVVLGDFRPWIEAKFSDAGGSGIDTSTFGMTIDRQSIRDRIDVSAHSAGLRLTASGFRYRPFVDLRVGLHQVEVSIADNHGNTQQSKWYFRIRHDTPAILNLLPASGATVNTLRPTFSGEFSDRGEHGLDLTSFELIIDGRSAVKQGARGLLLNDNGFSYRPPINLEAGEHNFSVKIVDQAQKGASLERIFSVEAIPINQTLGDLPLANLQGIGTTLATQYADKSAGQITAIKDLVNQDPQTLSDEVGLSLPNTIEHVTRADLLCSRVAFNRMNFSELWDRSVWDIAHMTDEQIVDLDQPLDEQGQVIVEAQGDVAELRENIALLFICLDNSVLHSLTFGDIVSNQVEGSYYG